MLSTQDIDPNDPNQRRFFLLRWLVQAWHWLLPPTQAHQDRETAAKRWTRLAVATGAAFAVIIVAALYAKPLQDAYQVWRADHHLKDAERYLEDKDLVNAILCAQKAYQSAPDYERTVRKNAELLTLIRRPQAMYFWDKLEKHTPLTEHDQIGRARALLGMDRPREARQALEQVLQRNPSNPEAVRFAEEVIGKQQSSGFLMDALKEFSEKNPDNVDSKLRLARLQLRSQEPTEQAAARETLWQHATAQDRPGLETLRVLAELETLAPDERRRAADLLDAHPESEGADWARALDLRVSLAPDQRDRLIDQTIERFKGKKGHELVPLMRWFTLNGEFSRVLTLLSEEEAKRLQPLLMTYLTALSMLGRIPEIERLVNDPSVMISPAWRSYYQVQLAVTKAVLGGTLRTDAREDVQRRIRATIVAAAGEGQLDMLLHIGTYCTDKLSDFYPEAADAFKAVAGRFSQRVDRQAFEGWIRASKLSGDSTRLVEAAVEANRRWPDDKVFMEELLYVRLLRGEGMEACLLDADRLLADNPSDSMRKLLKAIALWRLGDVQGAVGAAQQLDVAAISPGQRAVLAAIVRDVGPEPVANGDTAQFEGLIASILQPLPTARPLLAEESRLRQRAEKR